MASRSGKKPAWVVDKERARRGDGAASLWLFGIHAVRDALLNPRRTRLRLVVTRNAADRLADAIAASGMTPQIEDPRKFSAPLDPQSVHQGAALEVAPLDWGSVSEVCAPGAPAPRMAAPHRTGADSTGADAPPADTPPQDAPPPRVLLLDRVTDPHNVGAILRSAEVFGARAVIAPHRHSAPETGALAKTASGALERQPYLRVPNLANAMQALREMGYVLIGLDGAAETDLATAIAPWAARPIGLVLGAEGPGMRDLTMKSCEVLARIPAAGNFGSLNVSNAAAVSLYAATCAPAALD